MHLLLGLGCAPSTTPELVTAAPESGAPTTVDVAAGTGFGCMLDAAGGVDCSPANASNEEGALPCAHFWAQEQMNAGVVARNIAAGRDTLCIVSVEGDLGCSAQTDGFGAPPEGDFVDVAIGHGQACALGADGDIRCWGTPRDSVKGAHPGPYIGVSAAGFTACGLSAEGSVDCWGETDGLDPARMEGPFTSISGMCGRGTDGVVECWKGDPHPLWSEPVKAFATGTGTCGLDASGHLTCATESWAASSVAMPSQGGFVQVAMDEGGETACALHSDGTASCWGGRRMGCYKNPNW